jgi:hypothetical protein
LQHITDFLWNKNQIGFFYNVTLKPPIHFIKGIYTIYTKKSVIWCNLWRIPIILWGCLWSEKVWYIIMTFEGGTSYKFFGLFFKILTIGTAPRSTFNHPDAIYQYWIRMICEKKNIENLILYGDIRNIFRFYLNNATNNICF